MVKICPFLGEPCIKEKCVGYDTFPLTRYRVYDTVTEEGYRVVKECQIVEHCCSFANNKPLDKEAVLFEYEVPKIEKPETPLLISVSELTEKTKGMSVHVHVVKGDESG